MWLHADDRAEKGFRHVTHAEGNARRTPSPGFRRPCLDCS